VESEPGRKDARKLKRFIDAARAAAPSEFDPGDEFIYDWLDE
jgi:hypothetical protein